MKAVPIKSPPKAELFSAKAVEYSPQNTAQKPKKQGNASPKKGKHSKKRLKVPTVLATNNELEEDAEFEEPAEEPQTKKPKILRFTHAPEVALAVWRKPSDATSTFQGGADKAFRKQVDYLNGVEGVKPEDAWSEDSPTGAWLL